MALEPGSNAMLLALFQAPPQQTFTPPDWNMAAPPYVY